jgi:hypothetical protein
MCQLEHPQSPPSRAFIWNYSSFRERTYLCYAIVPQQTGTANASGSILDLDHARRDRRKAATTAAATAPRVLHMVPLKLIPDTLTTTS